MRRLLAGLALAVTLALVPAAQAGTVGTWSPVTEPDTSNLTRIGLFRTGDGMLHAAWARPNSPASGDDEIAHATITPGGAVSGANAVTGGYASVAAPDIGRANGGAGLAIDWGGIHSQTAQNNNASMATSDDSGAAWSLFPDDIITGGSAYAGNLRLATAPDGTQFQTWSITSGVYVHRGVDKNTPNFDYHYTQVASGPGSCCGYESDLGVDGANGSMWVAWSSLATGKPGVWVNQVDTASGAPAGPATRMPGSVVDFNGSEEFIQINGFTPITGRPGGGGVYVAYPTGYPTSKALLVWRIGDPAATTLDATDGTYRQVAIAAEPSGHLWVVWGNDTPNGGPLYARRSNADVTAWGPKVPIARLPGATGTWAMEAEAQNGLLDLLVNFTESDNSTTRIHHTQVPPLPPPSLGKSVNLAVIKGTVRIRPKGARSFVKLDELAQVPVGSTIDTTKGQVRIQTALPGGATQFSDFFEGVFVVSQAKTGLTDAALAGGNFKKCGPSGASAAKAKSVRHLWALGSGKFRTTGRYASATIRGTTWQVEDRCDGTITRVKAGSVKVRDFVRRKNVVVKAGKSYLAEKR